MSSKGGAALSAWPPSLDSGFCRRSEFIWRVLIFSVVFLTKLDTLRQENQNKTTCQQIPATRMDRTSMDEGDVLKIKHGTRMKCEGLNWK